MSENIQSLADLFATEYEEMETLLLDAGIDVNSLCF